MGMPSEPSLLLREIVKPTLPFPLVFALPMDLEAIVEEEVALEGLQGCSLQELWVLLQRRLQQEQLDQPMVCGCASAITNFEHSSALCQMLLSEASIWPQTRMLTLHLSTLRWLAATRWPRFQALELRIERRECGGGLSFSSVFAG